MMESGGAARFGTAARTACIQAVLGITLMVPTACASTTPAPDPATLPVGAPLESGSLSGQYLAGRHAQLTGDGTEAVRFYEDALAQDPENRALLRLTLVLLTAEGRIDDAVGLGGRLMRLSDDTPIADLLTAIVDLRDRRFEDAVARLTDQPNEGIGRFLVPLLKAWAEVGRNQFGTALAELAPLREKNGLPALADIHAALILDQAGQTEEAGKAFLQVLKDQGNENLRLTVLAGVFFERHGKTDVAHEIYGAYLAANPGSRLLDPALARLMKGGTPAPLVADAVDGTAQALFDLCGVWMQQGARERALLFGRLALGLKPDFPVAQILVAELLDNDDRFEAANRVYETINPTSPLSWTGRLRIASNLDDMDRPEDAIGQLRALAKEFPTEPDPLIRLGRILHTHQRYAEAVTAYDQAVKRIGKLDRHHWGILYRRGMALERSKQWKRAEADFLKALEFEPDQPYVLNYLGYSWVDQGLHIKRAQDMIKKAVSLRPNDGYIVDSLGWVHYRVGDFKGAVKELERAAELRPEDPIINDHLGDALWKVGRKREARFQWSRALSFDPEADLRETIEKKLKHGLDAVEDAKADGKTNG